MFGVPSKTVIGFGSCRPNFNLEGTDARDGSGNSRGLDVERRTVSQAGARTLPVRRATPATDPAAVPQFRRHTPRNANQEIEASIERRNAAAYSAPATREPGELTPHRRVLFCRTM